MNKIPPSNSAQIEEMNRILSNNTQIGGDHYKTPGYEEHWDRVFRLKLDYFQAAITKYVERCWKKNGLEDLRKARHFLDKYIELHEMVQSIPDRAASLGIDLTEKEQGYAKTWDLVKPTGWVGFTFEGADAEGFLFKCSTCKGQFRVVDGVTPPSDVHTCLKGSV
jgi:Protein of unknwon function (DUF3310)